MLMGGWKTWVAAIASIAGGVGLILKDVAAGTFDNFAEGWGLIVAGLGMIGIGNKIEKIN